MAALLRAAVRVLDFCRFAIVLAWLTFAVWAVWCRRPQRYFGLLSPGPESRGYNSLHPEVAAMRSMSPQNGGPHPHPLGFLVIVSARDVGANVTERPVLEFWQGLKKALLKNRQVASIEGHSVNDNVDSIGWTYDKNRRFLTPDHSLGALLVHIRPMGLHQLYSFFDDAEHKVQRFAGETEGFAPRFSAECVHMSMLLRDSKENLVQHFAIGDSITVSLALLVLFNMHGCAALCALPVLVVSVLLSFTLTVPYMKLYRFAVFEPSIFLSLAIALCFDYCLFFLTSFKEAFLAAAVQPWTNSRHLHRSAEAMIQEAVHPVFLSGIVLGVCCLSLTFFEVYTIRTIGIGCVIIVCSCLLVSLSLLPALLLCLGRHPKIFHAFQSKTSSVSFAHATTAAGSLQRQETLNLWGSIAQVCSRYPRMVLLLFALCLFLAMPICLRAHITTDIIMLYPRFSKHTQALMRMSAAGLPVGMTCLVYITLEMLGDTVEVYAREGSVLRSNGKHGVINSSVQLSPPCEDMDAIFSAVVARQMFGEGLMITSCASANQTLSVCSGPFREHILYICPRTCGVCSLWNTAVNPVAAHTTTSASLSAPAIRYPIMSRLGGKECWPLHAIQNSQINSAKHCRAHCHQDPRCTIWQHVDGKCFYGIGVTRPICKETSSSSHGELLYRARWSPQTLGPWLEPRYWNATMDAVARVRGVLAQLGRPCPACVRSVTQLLDGTPLRLEEAQHLLRTDASYALHFISLVGLGGEKISQHLRLELPFSPFSSEGELFYRRMQEALPAPGLVGDGCCTASVWDLSGRLVDSMEIVYASSWQVVFVTCCFVFVIVGIAFRSVMIPLRLLTTIIFTLVVVFALAVVFFQDFAHLSGLFWTAPVCALPIMIGLTLDYDLFLLTRVAVYRQRGFSTAEAVVKGCSRTGRTISLAGGIMSIAFSSLLFSDVWIVQQFGFLLVVSSIIDAFVVRAVLVPAVMLAVSHESNWWPRRMPSVAKNRQGQSSGDEDNGEPLRITADERDVFQLEECGTEYHNIGTDKEDSDF